MFGDRTPVDVILKMRDLTKGRGLEYGGAEVNNHGPWYDLMRRMPGPWGDLYWK